MTILGDCPRHAAVSRATSVLGRLYCAIDGCLEPLANTGPRVVQSDVRADVTIFERAHRVERRPERKVGQCRTASVESRP